MSNKGRKRLPDNVLKLRGTFRQDRRAMESVQLEVSVPEPPNFLSDEALGEWQRVTPQLERLGLISELDRAALAAYCQAYGRWVEAERGLRLARQTASAESAATPELFGEENGARGAGLVVRKISGNAQIHPLLVIANEAMTLTVRFATEFGITPAARSKVSGKKKAATEDKWAKFKK